MTDICCRNCGWNGKMKDLIKGIKCPKCLAMKIEKQIKKLNLILDDIERDNKPITKEQRAKLSEWWKEVKKENKLEQ